MNTSDATQRAIAMLEQQIVDLAGIRNATARDPSFKNWRQSTLTTMQRIWPGDQARSERFRRIPFSPADPRADLRAVREQYSRGCQEAGRVLGSFMEELVQHGAPELSGEALPMAPESDFEDGFPTLDLPAGDVAAATDPSRLAEDLLAGLGDDTPQGKDPSFEAPRLPVSPPPPPATPTTPVQKKSPGMKSRLRDLLGFAQLSAKTLAGFPRDNAAPSPPAPPILPAQSVQPSLEGMTPLGEGVGALPPQPAPTADSGPSDVPADWPLLPRRAPVETLPPAEQTPWSQTLSSVAAAASKSTSDVMPDVMPDAVPPTVGSPPAAPTSVAAPPTPLEPAPSAARSEGTDESRSVIMSRPTTLRGNIDKVSIESLISAEFRAHDAPENEAASSGASAPNEAPAVSLRLVPDLTPAATNEVEEADVPEPQPEPEPTPAKRPALALVRPLLDDPEFNVDPTPSQQLRPPSPDAPVSELARKPVRTAGKSAPVAPAQPVVPPAVADAIGHIDDQDPIDQAEAIAQATNPRVDPEESARATDEFMRSSPVLGASPRRAGRAAQELPDFGDADAIAVSSMAQDLTRMEVPKERHAEVRARLMDLARRLERGELEWSALRKAVWFAMEYPELARRLMPVLLPWIDRAA